MFFILYTFLQYKSLILKTLLIANILDQMNTIEPTKDEINMFATCEHLGSIG